MSSVTELLETILQKVSAAEPVSIVRLIGDDGASRCSIFWRGEFDPPLDAQISGPLRERLAALDSRGGIADVLELSIDNGESVRAVIEIVRPKVKLLVIGAGHVGQAVALIGATLGYEVTVIDDRTEFASRKRFPDRRIGLLVGEFGDAVGRAVISSSTAIVIVTRGHQSDELCLKSVLRSPATYLGMIGSKRRVLGVFKKLTSEGFTDEELGRVHAPIGLKIAARTPQEIAVSILAEIIDHVNNPERVRGEKGNGI
jgi:xanthine dehydrogenase accessory factor